MQIIPRSFTGSTISALNVLLGLVFHGPGVCFPFMVSPLCYAGIVSISHISPSGFPVPSSSGSVFSDLHFRPSIYTTCRPDERDHIQYLTQEIMVVPLQYLLVLIKYRFMVSTPCLSFSTLASGLSACVAFLFARHPIRATVKGLNS